MPIGHHVHVPRHDELVPWPVTEPYGDPAKARRAAARIQALARRFQPRRTLLVGMSHDMEHHECNARLRELLRPEALDVQLAHDGQFVRLNLDACRGRPPT